MSVKERLVTQIADIQSANLILALKPQAISMDGQ